MASGAGIADVASQLSEAKLSLGDVVLDHILIDSNEIYLGGAELS